MKEVDRRISREKLGKAWCQQSVEKFVGKRYSSQAARQWQTMH